MRFDVTDEDWAIIAPLLPRRIRGSEGVDDRKILNEIVYILRPGGPRRDLPGRYGPRTTVCNRYTHWRYARWARRGIWRDRFEIDSRLWQKMTRIACCLSTGPSSQRTALYLSGNRC